MRVWLMCVVDGGPAGCSRLSGFPFARPRAPARWKNPSCDSCTHRPGRIRPVRPARASAAASSSGSMPWLGSECGQHDRYGLRGYAKRLLQRGASTRRSKGREAAARWLIRPRRALWRKQAALRSAQRVDIDERAMVSATGGRSRRAGHHSASKKMAPETGVRLGLPALPHSAKEWNHLCCFMRSALGAGPGHPDGEAQSWHAATCPGAVRVPGQTAVHWPP